MLSFSEMCSLVAVRQEMDSWMKQRMLVEPSQVEQLTFPRACTQACSCEGARCLGEVFSRHVNYVFLRMFRMDGLVWLSQIYKTAFHNQ